MIVGNPPFLGGSKKRGELGSDYFDALAKAYPKDRVPPGADLVCYWFDKARIEITKGRLKSAGLVATNSIRGGANRTVLDAIARDTPIFTAWSDEPWVNAGAAVRVSLICFGQSSTLPMLNGMQVGQIHADLTAGKANNSGNDLTLAMPLPDSQGACFMGASKKAPFDIEGALARKWLSHPNPNGISNSRVVRPLCNGIDLTRRWGDRWIVDFGTEMSEADASLFEAPFGHVVDHVKPVATKNSDKQVARNWWRHARPRVDMRTAIDQLDRFIITVAVAKHRTFSWMNATVLPDQATLAIAREDDSTFGILHSRFHELWSLRMCTFLGVGNDPRYTPTTCFETFPFPDKLTPADTAHQQTESVDGVLIPAQLTDTATDKTRSIAFNIAKAAAHLVKTRDNWLNPPEWVDWVQSPEEAAAGFPMRAVAKKGNEAELKKKTLTNLYNARPAWLAMAHEAIDKAVAAAYGWTDYTPDMSDDEILKRLLALNLSRTSSNGTAAAPNDKDQDDATEH